MPHAGLKIEAVVFTFIVSPVVPAHQSGNSCTTLEDRWRGAGLNIKSGVFLRLIESFMKRLLSCGHWEENCDLGKWESRINRE